MPKRVLDQGQTQRTAVDRELGGVPPQRSQRVVASRSSARGELPSWRPSARLEPVERYGRFEILGRIGRGGMAEILLARERSPVGGVRHLVIKRVLPEVRDLDDMLHMFLDESRVVMGLSHPNLCQIFEVGEQGGAWFIAMEWVNGVTLHQLVRRARELPDLDYAVLARVIAQCAEALHYAHTARDAEGRLMNLVHRDVSPHNLMVAYDGRVKLLDFGIAKSTATTHRTEAGVVKGKVCYMAPEQWQSQPLDARTDVFALGACLYEALSGRVLFKRDSQVEVMRAVVSGEVSPLTEIAGEIPPALAEIAHRALQNRPDRRYQSAREMAEALERFIAAAATPVSAARVADYTRRLFGTEVQLGPVLERAGRGAQFAVSGELLLPPLPASLRGMAKRPDSVRPLPPPPFSFSAPALSLPTRDDPLWPREHDLGGLTLSEPARLSTHEASHEPVAETHDAAFGDQAKLPSFPAPTSREGEETPRPLARTVSMRVGPRVRRVAFSMAALLALVPLAWWLRASVPPQTSALVSQLPDGAPLRVGTFSAPAFTLLAPHGSALPSAPLARPPLAAEAAVPDTRARPRHRGSISINTQPWSTVYLGSRLLGSTPLADVQVPRGTLMLKLVDRDGRVHLRRIPASQGSERTVYFEF